MSNIIEEEVWLGPISAPLLYLTTKPDQIDSSGVEWHGGGIPEGVDEPPGLRITTEQKAGDHGDYASSGGFFDSRELTVHFAIEAPNSTLLQKARDRVLSIGADGKPFRLTFQRGGSTRWTTVLRAKDGKAPTFKTTDNSSIVEFPVYAPDPRFYGSPVVITFNL